jgi:hypothetical protein
VIEFGSPLWWQGERRFTREGYLNDGVSFMSTLLLTGLGAIIAKLQNIEVTVTFKLNCQ